MARILNHCATHNLPLAGRAARAVALLELIQERVPTEAKLVAACLYDRLDRGNQQGAVHDALEELRRANLLGYSEKHGYKVQSTSGEEWERERRDITISREQQSELIQDVLKHLVADQDQPKLDGRQFPWRALFSDGRRGADVRLEDPRDPAAITVDFRFLSGADERDHATWVNRSTESTLSDRLLWVVGDTEEVEAAARELGRSVALVKRHEGRSESLPSERRRLWFEEKTRKDELVVSLRRAVDAAWLDGRLYFRGKAVDARDVSGSAAQVLAREADRVVRALFPHFVATRVSTAEVLKLLELPEMNAPSPKFIDELGLLELERGRFVPTCSGVVPRRVLDYIVAEGGATGASLYQHFGGPPYGYAPEVVRACVAALLRATKLRIQTEENAQISAVRDAGVDDVFQKERGFKTATIYPAGDDTVGLKGRARICKFFEERLGLPLDRENDAIADAVSTHFPAQMARLREVFEHLRKIPNNREVPAALVALEDALGRCYKLIRQTEPTVREVARQLDVLNDGISRLGIYAAELTATAIDAVRKADDVAKYQLTQLERIGFTSPELASARGRLEKQLASDTPWRGIVSVTSDLAIVTGAYQEARRAILIHQEDASEAARGRIKRRDGFATLTNDQSNHVLRPITEARIVTDETAVSPQLDQLRDAFDRALPLAERESDDRLDALLSQGTQQMVRRVTHNLGNREIQSTEELERVLEELRERVRVELAAGHRVRLV